MAKLRLLKTGHGDLTLAEWNKDRPESVALAESAFAEHFTAGRLAFRVDGPGRTRAIREFEKSAPEILIVPAIQGGGSGSVQSSGFDMIRTGYLRWEIEVEDNRCKGDERSREVIFLARPSFRTVRIKQTRHLDAAERFVRGEAAYDSVLRTLERDGGEVDVRIPDVGPRPFRYSESDRGRLPRYWMEKLQREASAFATEVVRAAASFPQLVISSPALRAGYARLSGVRDLPRHRGEKLATADK